MYIIPKHYFKNIGSNYPTNMQKTSSAGRPSIARENARPWEPCASKQDVARVEAKMVGLTESIAGTPAGPNSIEGYNSAFQDKVGSAIEQLGIVLGEGELLEVSMGANRLITVDGLQDESKAKALSSLLNTVNMVSVSGKTPDTQIQNNMDTKVFYLNSEYARSAPTFEEANLRAQLIALKDCAYDTILAQTGVGLDISSLTRDESGAIAGYPDELAWIFEGDFSLPPQTDAEKQGFATAKSVLHIVGALLDAGYDDIPNVQDIDVRFHYTGDDFGRTGFDKLV